MAVFFLQKGNRQFTKSCLSLTIYQERKKKINEKKIV